MASASNNLFQNDKRTTSSDSCKLCTPPTPKKHSDMEVHNSNIDVHEENPIMSRHCSSYLKNICAPAERNDAANVVSCKKGKENAATCNITAPPSTNYRKRHMSCSWPWSIKETKREEAKTIRTSLGLVDGILHSADGIELEEQDKLGGSADPERITIDSGVASLNSVE
ncbi:unnamed protein product [Owenia fusiformis]|uniref:Uncharacterized protein n=1 Tax=Owenia fusiformis TaxID=6347 RepID=A0A8S4NBU3_OWEFU|nr:unnamed protein product [Owenia fusiformis]